MKPIPAKLDRFQNLNGWVNRILRVDLSNMQIEAQPIKPYVPDFLGPHELAANGSSHSRQQTKGHHIAQANQGGIAVVTDEGAQVTVTVQGENIRDKELAAKKQLLDRPKTRQTVSCRMKNTARVLGAYLRGLLKRYKPQ